MARVSAQTILKTSDNIAANFVTNTMYFDFDEFQAVDKVDLATQQVGPQIAVMYNAMNAVLAGLQQTGHRTKFVDIDGPAPQYPFYEHMWDFTAPLDQNQLPPECAIVSSFEAAQVGGINQASRRGRIFLGPIPQSRVENDGRVTDAARTNIATAMKAFNDDQDTAGFSGWTWQVYSRTLNSMARVEMGHVDNNFDTQRRRSVESTARSIWT